MPSVNAARVLVVDDDAGICDLLLRALSGVGYQVECAADGEAGWDALCAGSFDLLITDHDMPKLTGLDLLRRVRAGPLDLPVLFISGSMPSLDTDFFHWLPPGVALDKPFPLSRLLQAADDLLRVVRRPDQTDDGQTILNLESSPPATWPASPLGTLHPT